MLKLESAGHAAVAELCAAVLEVMCGDEQETVLRDMEALEDMKCVHEAFVRIKKCFMCLAHLLSVPGFSTAHDDVKYLSCYEGQEFPERSLKAVLLRPGSSWQELVTQVIKVSGQAVLVEPERLAVDELVQKQENLSEVELDRLMVAYERLQGGLRPLELKKYAAQTCDRLLEQTEQILQGRVAAGSVVVDLLLRGMNLFASTPGVLSQIEKLEKWKMDELQHVSMQDLVHEAQCEEVHWEKLSELIGHVKDAELSIPDELQAEAPNFLSRMWDSVAACAEDRDMRHPFHYQPINVVSHVVC